MDVYYFAEFRELSGLKMFAEADRCWAVNKFLGWVYVVLCGIREIFQDLGLRNSKSLLACMA